MTFRTAAIVTVGSELVEGLRVDTNTAEVARALSERGFRIAEALSVGDDVTALADALRRLTHAYDLVVTTGGLGPTHDDITREAAALALGVALVRDPATEAALAVVVSRHSDPEAAAHVMVQADILPGSTVLPATTGTAPGLIVPTPHGTLILLPGPPAEMRPMLAAVAELHPRSRAKPHELGVVGLSESDAQVIALRALDGAPGVDFTVLAKPGDVKVLLIDGGAGGEALASAALRVADALGDRCYAADGSSLSEMVVRTATRSRTTFALAESCTGGLVCSAITGIAGASGCFLGGAVTYSNESKVAQLDVPPGLLAQFGAVSEESARAMAEVARDRFHADIAVSVTGIAGPAGGTAEKPVGLVWFGVADTDGSRAVSRRFSPSGRDSIRARACSTALDLLRTELALR